MTTLMGAALASCLAVLGYLSSLQVQVVGPVSAVPKDSFNYWLIILAPVALLLPTGYAAILGANRAVRSYYLRVLEREIGKEMKELCGRLRLSYSKGLNYPAFSSTYFEVVRSSPKNGTGIPRLFAFFVVLVFAGANICLLKVAYAELLLVNGGYLANGYFVLYMTIVLSLGTLSYQTGLNGRSFFRATVRDVNRRYDEGFESQGSQLEIYRGQLAKVKGGNVGGKNTLKLFPKPDDLTKIIVDIIGALLAGMLLYFNLDIKIDGLQFAHISLSLLFFEGFVYQTRYVLNDLLGVPEESRLKSVDVRRRIVEEEDVFLAARYLFARLTIIVCATLFAFRLGLTTVYVISILSLTLITALYEYFRYSLGRSRDGSLQQRLCTIAMFPLVSLGMVLRLWVSFTVYYAIAVHNLDRSSPWYADLIPSATSGDKVLNSTSVLICLLVWGALFGVVTVSLIWIVEALYEVDRRGTVSFSTDWQTPGKLHVLASLRLLFWVFGVRVMRKHQTDERQMKNGLSPHQALAELANGSSKCDRSSFHRWPYRYLRMVVTPWTWGSVIGMVLSVSIASRVCAIGISNWVLALVFLVAVPLVLLAEDMLMVSTKVNKVILMLFSPLVVSILLFALSYTTYIEAPEASNRYWFIGLSLFLMFYGGPMSFMYFRTTYEETRNVLVSLVEVVRNIDRQFALMVTDRVMRGERIGNSTSDD